MKDQIITKTNDIINNATWLQFTNDVNVYIVSVQIKSKYGTISKLVTTRMGINSKVNEKIVDYIDDGGELYEMYDSGMCRSVVVYSLYDDELLVIDVDDLLSTVVIYPDDRMKNWVECWSEYEINNKVKQSAITNLKLPPAMAKIANILYHVEELGYTCWVSYILLEGEVDLTDILEAHETNDISDAYYTKLVDKWKFLIYKYKELAVGKLESEKIGIEDTETLEEIDIIIQMIGEINFENKESPYYHELHSRVSSESIIDGKGSNDIEDLLDYWPVLLLPKPFTSYSATSMIQGAMNPSYSENGEEINITDDPSDTFPLDTDSM